MLFQLISYSKFSLRGFNDFRSAVGGLFFSWVLTVATAVALIQRGISKIVVYEKANELQPIGAAIGLFPNGFSALNEISPTLTKRVREACIHHTISKMYDLDGSTLVREIDFTKSSAGSFRTSPTYMVWYLLQQYLCEELPPHVIQLGTIVESYQVDPKDERVIVSVQNRISGGQKHIISGRVLVGADGIHSTIRRLMLGDIQLRYHGKRMFRGVLPIDQLPEGFHCPPTGVSHSYQGNEMGKLFAFRETSPGIMTFTAMAVFPNDSKEESEIHESKKDRMHGTFHEFPSDVHDLIDHMKDSSIYENAIYDIPVLERWSEGPVVLIGDAAHAMTPGMGQGANQGLEDACELAYCVTQYFLPGQQERPNVSHDGGNDRDKEHRTLLTTRSISSVLEEFWRQRLDRIKFVHGLSSERTQAVNQSTKESRIYDQANDQSFEEKLYDWKPSFSTE